MAVETKFVVVRKGEEKMTFANKKEADAYDKMLDMADAFTDWLLQSELEIDESLAENIALRLAEQKDTVQHILRTSKLPEEEAAKEPVAQTEEPAVTEAETEEAAEETTEETAAAPAPKKTRAVKAA
ncbi:YebG family protein [Rahnella variigena]|uniref:DNA damage-inducible SOS regulon protein n=1 Tax=Rahnella variigena TaxID=574964 RepID=A0ABX9PR32_9GAMM|nr:YebG family protein [Rahnella variigena]RJT50389.1 DNA damage-inducible SOS regulon protein [Rahnella variigena]RKF66379.1 DNA damage-inducible SOS regulon protein [Rahnella variigena]